MRGKHKLRNYVLLLVVIAMIVTIPNLFSTSKAEKITDTFIPSEIEYEEDNQKAVITFLTDEVNKELYDITKITEKNEQKVIFDKTANQSAPITYETDKNGDYTFIVDYVEKVEIPAEETQEEVQQQPVLPEEDIQNEETAEQLPTEAEKKEEQNNTSDAQQGKETPATLEEPVEDTQTDKEEQVKENALQTMEEQTVDAITKADEGITQDTPTTLEEPVFDETPPAEETPAPTEPQYEYVEKQVEMTITVDGIEKKDYVGDDLIDSENEGIVSSSDEMIDSKSSDNNLVNLENSFYISGQMSKGLDWNSKIPISKEAYSIKQNTMGLGSDSLASKGYTGQTVVATTNYKLDFRRSFEISGSASSRYAPDGFAASFHTVEKYDAPNVGSSFGVYREPKLPISDNITIPYGIVMEVDTGNTMGMYLDDPNRPIIEPHLAIHGLDGTGKPVDTLDKIYTDKNIFGSDKIYKIVWTPKDDDLYGGTLEFTYSSIIIRATFSNSNYIKRFIDNGGAHLTLSSSLWYDFPEGMERPSKIEYKIDSVRYTDFNPEFNTQIFNEDGTEATYVLPGSTITVQHEMWNKGKLNSDGISYTPTNYSWNEKGQPDRLTNKLAMKAMDLNVNKDNPSDVRQLDIVPGSHEVKEGDGDWESHADHTFSRTEPIYPYVPNRGEHFYVRYKVQIPAKAIIDGNSSDNLYLSYLAGEDGMTQYPFERNIDVFDQPKIYSKSGETQKTVYDVVHESSITNIENTIWQNLYGKTSHDANEVELSKAGSYTNFTVAYEYKQNLSSVGQNLPPTIQNGDIISLHLIITDNITQATNTFVRYLLTSDNANITDPGTDGSGNNYYASGNNLTSISETKLVTMDTTAYTGKVTEESKPKMLKVDTAGNAEIITGFTLPDVAKYVDGSLVPNDVGHDITIQFTVTGVNNSTITVKQPVTANTWDYDDTKETVTDGAVGFIIIPKGIGLDTSNGTGSAEVKFSQYENATNVEYTVSAQDFTLSNKDDPQDILNINVINSTGQVSLDNPFTFNFKMFDDDLNRVKNSNVKSQWNGKVTFTFERGTLH